MYTKAGFSEFGFFRKGFYYGKEKNNPCINRMFFDNGLRCSNAVFGSRFESSICPPGSS